MITNKPNGDVFFMGVRVYNGDRKAPVRWLECLGYVAASVAVMFFLIFWLGIDDMGVL